MSRTFLFFVNIPAEAIRIPDIFYDIGHKYGALIITLCANRVGLARQYCLVTMELAY